MRKTKGEARRLPRGVKLLSIAAALVLTCVLAASLIGTSFAADFNKGVCSTGHLDARRGDRAVCRCAER